MLTWDEKYNDENQNSAWIDALLIAAKLSDVELDEMLYATDLFDKLMINIKPQMKAETNRQVSLGGFRVLGNQNTNQIKTSGKGFQYYLLSPQVYFEVTTNCSKAKPFLFCSRGQQR